MVRKSWYLQLAFHSLLLLVINPCLGTLNVFLWVLFLYGYSCLLFKVLTSLAMGYEFSTGYYFVKSNQYCMLVITARNLLRMFIALLNFHSVSVKILPIHICAYFFVNFLI